MKIWTNNGTVDVVLCDHGRGGPSNFVPQVVRTKQIQTFLRGAFAKPIARGNTHRVWQFSVRKEHATITAAQLYLMGLHAQVPEQEDVTVELDDKTTQLILPDCCIEFEAAPPLGLLSTVAWILTFSTITGVDS